MGVVFTHGITYNTGALTMWFIRTIVQLYQMCIRDRVNTFFITQASLLPWPIGICLFYIKHSFEWFF